MKKNKNFIPLCMIPFIANMMSDKEESGEVTPTFESFFEITTVDNSGRAPKKHMKAFKVVDKYAEEFDSHNALTLSKEQFADIVSQFDYWYANEMEAEMIELDGDLSIRVAEETSLEAKKVCSICDSFGWNDISFNYDENFDGYKAHVGREYTYDGDTEWVENIFINGDSSKIELWIDNEIPEDLG